MITCPSCKLSSESDVNGKCPVCWSDISPQPPEQIEQVEKQRNPTKKQEKTRKTKFVFPSYGITLSLNTDNTISCHVDEDEEYDREELQSFVGFITAGIQSNQELMEEILEDEAWGKLEDLYMDWVGEVEGSEIVERDDAGNITRTKAPPKSLKDKSVWNRVFNEEI